MLHFEGGSDNILSIGIHPEGEGRSVAFGAIVIISGQDLHHLPGGAVLRQDWPVVLQEPGCVIVDVLHYHRQGGSRRLRRVAVINGQDFDLLRQYVMYALLLLIQDLVINSNLFC